MTESTNRETTVIVMTTKQTAKAATDAKPEPGEELIYIDWEGKRLHEKPAAKHTVKPEVKQP